MSRYVLHPGWVVSADGGRHWISGYQLRILYRLPPNSRSVIRHQAPRDAGFVPMIGDVDLHPRNDGDYELPCP